MKYCSYCGCNVENSNKNYCENCGHAIKKSNNYFFDDKYPFLWGMLGFFIPIAGLVLFLLWHDSNPRSSKSAGIGALIRAILSFILTFVVIILITTAPYEDKEDVIDDHGDHPTYQEEDRRGDYPSYYEDEYWY